MSVLKGRIHHTAEGIGDGLAAVGVAAVAATGVIAAVVITGATTGVAGVAAAVATAGAAAGAVSDRVVHKTRDHKYAIPADAQKTWQRCGVGLLAAFSLAVGIGAGVLVNKNLPQNDNTPQTAHTFNAQSANAQLAPK